MPFSFGNPAFLLGALAIAVPIYLHLYHRRTPIRLDFPSLRLLRRSLETVQQRARLRNLILLALRVLVLLLVVLGLARPYFQPGNWFGLTHTRQSVAMVVILDNSMSMGASEQGISLYSTAKAKALEIIDRMGPSDKASVALIGEPSQLLFNQLTWDKSELKEAVRNAPLTSGGTDLAGGVKLALGLLKQARASTRQVIVITDGTAVTWKPFLDKYDVNLIDKDVELLLVKVGKEAPANLTLAELTVGTNLVIKGRSAPVTALITNHAARPQKTRLSLFLDHEKKHEAEVSLEPGQSKRVSVVLPFLREGDAQVTASIDPDALLLDNVRHRAVQVLPPQPVLLVRPTPPQGSTAPAEDVFLRHALNPLNRLDAPMFRVESRDHDELDRVDLTTFRAIVLINLPPLSSKAVGALRDYVLGGGNIVWWLGPMVDPAWCNLHLVDELGAAALLPGRLMKRLGNAVAKVASYRLTDVDFGHSAFRLFGVEGNGDPGRARIYEFYKVEPAPGAAVLARFSQGLPAMLEERRGEGKILLIPTSADTRWTDWPLKPTFLPFVHQLLLGMLADRPLAADDVTPGTPVSLVIRSQDITKARLVPPDGKPVELPALKRGGGLTHLTIGQTNDPGFYRLELERARGPRNLAFTVNPPASEGDLTRFDLRQVPRFRTFTDKPGQAGAIGEQVELMQQGRELATPLLWLLFALLLIESLFANIAPRGVVAR